MSYVSKQIIIRYSVLYIKINISSISFPSLKSTSNHKLLIFNFTIPMADISIFEMFQNKNFHEKYIFLVLDSKEITFIP